MKGRLSRLGVLANDSDTEGDIFTHTLGVSVPASLGAAARGDVAGVSYRSDQAGYDIFEYRVCDRYRQCGSAEATVTVEARG